MILFNIEDFWSAKLRALYEFSVLATEENSLFNTLETEFNNLMSDQFIETATETGIARREALLDITPFGDDTLETRRFRVGVLWNNSIPYTEKMLISKLTSILGVDGYTMTKDYGNYALTITLNLGQKRMRDDVESMVSQMIPANLVLTVTLQYNRHVDLASFTHAQLATKTHLQLREEEL